MRSAEYPIFTISFQTRIKNYLRNTLTKESTWQLWIVSKKYMEDERHSIAVEKKISKQNTNGECR